MKFINRLKAELSPPVDFSEVIQELKDEGYSLKEIAEITKADLSLIQRLHADAQNCAQFQHGLNLIDMYLRVTHKNLPFYR